MLHPHDPRSEKTCEALIEAGLFCFSERGFDGTSLRMVAERAGKNTSLIAHHFGNKEGLYLAVFRDMLTRHAHAWFKGPVVEAEELEKDPERAVAILRHLIGQMVGKMRRDFDGGDPKQTAYFRLWMAAVQTPIPELESLIRECVQPLRLQIAACIRAIRPDLPLSEIPFWCALVHGQCLANTRLRRFNQLVFGPECYPESVGKLSEQIADITLRALGRP
ncbi:MAG TPA: TetR/AcrR family transcriptional regulator [Holophaga sp.]|nr:TetR/AcrR family transcriptional regulator [Holophaga sp.]HPS66439.1 TetR/AcrR family transcriptional regulator [Holophaga sp.]